MTDQEPFVPPPPGPATPGADGYPPPAPPAYPPAPGYGYPPPYDPDGPVQVSGPNDTVWAALSHLSFFVLAIIFPLIVYLTAAKDSPYVRRHATEALNFHLSLLVYALVSMILVLILIGIVLLIAVGIFGLVMTIIATVAAAQGQDYRYPLTIRMVR